MLKPTTITAPVSLWLSARYYDSEIGRWPTVDPLSDDHPGESPYVYCSNNPINLIDAKGLFAYKYTIDGVEVSQEIFEQVRDIPEEPGDKQNNQNNQGKSSSAADNEDFLFTLSASVAIGGPIGYNVSSGILLDFDDLSSIRLYYNMGYSYGYFGNAGFTASIYPSTSINNFLGVNSWNMYDNQNLKTIQAGPTNL